MGATTSVGGLGVGISMGDLEDADSQDHDAMGIHVSGDLGGAFWVVDYINEDDGAGSETDNWYFTIGTGFGCFLGTLLVSFSLNSRSLPLSLMFFPQSFHIFYMLLVLGLHLLLFRIFCCPFLIRDVRAFNLELPLRLQLIVQQV
jgi:hypothetical protein